MDDVSGVELLLAGLKDDLGAIERGDHSLSEGAGDASRNEALRDIEGCLNVRDALPAHQPVRMRMIAVVHFFWQRRAVMRVRLYGHREGLPAGCWHDVKQARKLR